MRLTAVLLALMLLPFVVAQDSPEPEPDDAGDARQGPPDHSNGTGASRDDSARQQEPPPEPESGSDKSGSGDGQRDPQRPNDDDSSGSGNSGPGSNPGQQPPDADERNNTGSSSGNHHGNGSIGSNGNGNGNGHDNGDHGPGNDHDNGSPDGRPNNDRDEQPESDRETDERETDDEDDSRNNGNQGPGSSSSRRVRDDEQGFRTMPDQAQHRRPAVSFQTDRAATAVEQAGVNPLQMQVESILEFRDEDGDDAYDLAEPVLQRFALRDMMGTVATPSDDVRDVTYTFPSGGQLILRFHMDGAGDEGAKFDVILNDFPFTANDTRVAVAVHVEVPGGLRFAEVAGEPALAGVAGQRVPFISWARNVTVDGIDQQVAASAHVSVDPEQATGLLFWSYPQGAAIVHDPVLGVTLIPLLTLGNPSVYAVAMVAGIAVLAVGYEARRRYRP